MGIAPTNDVPKLTSEPALHQGGAPEQTIKSPLEEAHFPPDDVTISFRRELENNKKLPEKNQPSDAPLPHWEKRNGEVHDHASYQAFLAKRRERFAEMVKPYILEGLANQPTVLFYSGLGGTTHQWRDVATKVNINFDLRVEAYPLKGHTGSLADLRSTTWRDWVQDIVNKATECCMKGHKPIFVGFSTGALAGLEAALQHPELFGGLILVGTPFKIAGFQQGKVLSIADFLSKNFPKIDAQLRKLSFHLGNNDTEDVTKLKRKTPHIEDIPAPTLVELNRLRKTVLTLLQDLRETDRMPPLYIYQGELDPFVKPKAAKKICDALPVKEKSLDIIEEATHAVMLGKKRRELTGKIYDRINHLLENESFEPPEPIRKLANQEADLAREREKLQRLLQELAEKRKRASGE